jgi:hypothetical protein
LPFNEFPIGGITRKSFKTKILRRSGMSKIAWLVIILVGVPTIACMVLVFISPKKRNITDKNVLYNDRHLEIYPDYLIINGFYIGPIGRMRIDYDSIKTIKTVLLGTFKGRFRIQGTGDFKTWFAHDINRPSKKESFIIFRKNKWWRIGFSVEDYDKVLKTFNEIGLPLL